MSDFSYKVVVGVCYPAFWVSSRPVLLHMDRVPQKGAFILAPNHLSHYDVPCLMGETHRNLDFMSVAEFLKSWWVGPLFKAMNCLFLDRGKVDATTTRQAVARVKNGRALVMFPEGRIRDWDDSVVHGKPFKPGAVRIAMLANVPIMPCVILGTIAYKQTSAWAPIKRIRYGINYGQMLHPRTDLPEDEAAEDLTRRLTEAYQSLYAELAPALPPGMVFGEGHVPAAKPDEPTTR